MILAFEEWELDTELYELRRAGELRPLEPKVFDLLHLLVREAGRIVEKQEILDTVWPGQSVSDAAVSTAIKSVRRALDDDGNAQRYLQTVRSRGFRLQADVSILNGAPASLEMHGSLLGEAMAAEGDQQKGTAGARPKPARPVVAVLPFEVLGPEVEIYFADGLVGDVIANLSRFRELAVVARGTTLQFRNLNQPLPDFCRRIGADYAVEGTVRRAGNRLRVTAQLVDAITGANQWTDTYDRDVGDIFVVQDELTRTLAAHLGVHVQDLDRKQSMRKSRSQMDAHDCVLQARQFTSLLSAHAHSEARDLLERAVSLDPGNADAHALLANVILAEHRFGVNPRPQPLERSLDLANAAVRIDPRNAYARCWLGIVHFFRGENDQFEEEAARALKLNANDPEILADIGHFLAFSGEFERGVEMSSRARQLNPLHPGWYFFSLARLHFDQREYRQVLADVERINLPRFYWTRLLRAAALGHLRDPEAPAAFAEILELKPDFDGATELKKWNAAAADRDHILEGLNWASAALAQDPVAEPRVEGQKVN